MRGTLQLEQSHPPEQKKRPGISIKRTSCWLWQTPTSKCRTSWHRRWMETQWPSSHKVTGSSPNRLLGAVHLSAWSAALREDHLSFWGSLASNCSCRVAWCCTKHC
jgi:hypothetical protein